MKGKSRKNVAESPTEVTLPNEVWLLLSRYSYKNIMPTLVDIAVTKGDKESIAEVKRWLDSFIVDKKVKIEIRRYMWNLRKKLK